MASLRQSTACFLGRSRFRRVVVLLFVTLALASPALAQDVTAFVGVNVVPMDSERVIRGQTVIVRDARIAEIGDVGSVVIPPEADVIYGRGRWLLPGLVDMHVHIRARDLDRYLENGITTVRDMAGIDSVLTIAREVREGARTGPRIITSTRLLNGPNPQSPYFSVVVSSASVADSIVASELARGGQAVKLYEQLPLPVYDALIAAARARGVKIAEHVSGYVSVEHAMVSQDSIEHLMGYERALAPGHYGLDAWLDADRDRMPEYARLARESGVWNCPTLIVFANSVTVNMPPDERALVLENRRLFVGALHDAGARILAGTDSGYLVPAGTSLLDEFDLLRGAGLTPYEVLVAATRSPAEYLELTEEIGTIAVGRRADLVLYYENPLEKFSTLRSPVGVMLSGRWIPLVHSRRRAVRRPVSQQGLAFALWFAADERP